MRAAQTVIQAKIQTTSLRDALLISQSLVILVNQQLAEQAVIESLGIEILMFLFLPSHHYLKRSKR